MKLSFHGAVAGVTGSCFLLETSTAKILIDCGMFQGERLVSHENLNEFPFDPKTIDAVLITHAHYDHTGRLALLAKNGFHGTVYMTPPTKDLAKIVLEDALNMMHDNAKRSGDPILYSKADLEKALGFCSGVNYHTQIEPAPGLRAMFHDAGHILGSSFISVDVPANETKSGKPMRFVFTGDVGNERVPILPRTEVIEQADVIISESTYGDQDHDPHEGRVQELASFATRILNRGGTLIIPAFSIERTQELIYELDRLADDGLIPNVPVYLDSPLAIRATEIYRRYSSYLEFDREILKSPDHDFFSFPNLKETLTIDESKKINDDSGHKIIIAGSGMMTGGRILHHLKRYLADERSGILIIGFQAKGTLGRKIEEKQSPVTIFAERFEIKSEIKKLSTFSAHADRKKLASWLKPAEGDAKTIFLVHGDSETKIKFKEYLAQTIKSDIVIPKPQEEFEF